MTVKPLDKNFEFLFKSNFRKMVYFSYKIVGSKESAEDIVQEVFLNYLNKKDLIEPTISNISDYLFRAVKNASLNAIRHQNAAYMINSKYEAPTVDESNIAVALIEAEIISELHDAIKTLPEGCQNVMKLGFIEEKTNQEIADELGISINTVKSQKQRALQLLRLRVSPDIYSLLIFVLLN